MKPFFVIACCTLLFPLSGLRAQIKGYPEGVKEITFPAQADNSHQPALFWMPKANDKPVPLLVALHTWSNNYKQAGGEAEYAKWCQAMNWCFIHPDFRGSNTTPNAMGSEYVYQDIMDAIAYAKLNANVDENRIYAIGVSGGGHAAMYMAARSPDMWAGVSAWCGISDIAAWHAECNDTRFNRYAKNIEKVLGGSPATNPHIAEQAKLRSPNYWLAKAKTLPPLDINHGIKDGRTGSVPFTHAYTAWNAAHTHNPNKKFTVKDIAGYYQTQTIPKTWSTLNEAGPDILYGQRQPLFQRVDGNLRLTIFDGGHEIVHDAALNWLAAQVKGQQPTWQVPPVHRLQTSEKNKQSGK